VHRYAGGKSLAGWLVHRRPVLDDAFGLEEAAQGPGTQPESLVLHIDEGRLGSQMACGIGRCDEAERLRDDQVALLHSCQLQRDLKRRRAVHHGNCHGSAGSLFQHILEAADVGPDGGNEGGFDRILDVLLLVPPKHRRVQGNVALPDTIDLTQGRYDVTNVRAVHTLYLSDL
jgi:hypothetical protein